jgi:hypothetical protein
MGEAEDYTLVVTSHANDIGVQQLLAPLSDINLSDSENIVVRVSNFGSLTQSGFLIYYQVDTNMIVCDTFSAQLPGGSVMDITFSVPFNFSADSTDWPIRCWTVLQDDENSSNDSLLSLISNLPVIYCEAASQECDEFVSRVTMGSIDNSSACSSNGYSDYFTMINAVHGGEDLYIEVWNNDQSNDFLDECGVWIDWNGNGDFHDDQAVIVEGGPLVFWATTQVPTDAFIGKVRFRTRIVYDETPEPCGLSAYGETEDYCINNFGNLPGGTGELRGVIRYANPALTGLGGLDVFLMQGADTVDITTTDNFGFYFFGSLFPGQYTVQVLSDKTWGGVNAIDGLQILKHFTGFISLAGVSLAAADMDGTMYVNAIDGLLAIKRFAGLISSFDAGDWIFDQPASVTIGNDIVELDILGLCTGDVDGSYVPGN